MPSLKNAAKLTDVRCIVGLELLNYARLNHLWLANDHFGQAARNADYYDEGRIHDAVWPSSLHADRI